MSDNIAAQASISNVSTVGTSATVNKNVATLVLCDEIVWAKYVTSLVLLARFPLEFNENVRIRTLELDCTTRP